MRRRSGGPGPSMWTSPSGKLTLTLRPWTDDEHDAVALEMSQLFIVSMAGVIENLDQLGPAIAVAVEASQRAQKLAEAAMRTPEAPSPAVRMELQRALGLTVSAAMELRSARRCIERIALYHG